jgi:hypothetical protein
MRRNHDGRAKDGKGEYGSLIELMREGANVTTRHATPLEPEDALAAMLGGEDYDNHVHCWG